MPILAAVGDLMLGDTASVPGFGFASQLGERPLEAVLGAARPAWADADIVFGNLETILSQVGYDPRRLHSRHMRGSPRLAGELRRLGFTVLNLANNHANQHGDEAFADTCRLVREAGIDVCGLRGREPWCSEPLIVASRGEQIGILGYCLHPRQYSPHVTPPFAEGSPAAITADISRLRPGVDSIIVSVHWGEEFVAAPSREELALARGMIEAGASVVLGHHPHVVRQATSEGGRIIALSLGNFVSDMVWDRATAEGVVLRCLLERGVASGLGLQRSRVTSDYRVVLEPDSSSGLLSVPALPVDSYVRESRRLGRIMRRRRMAWLGRNLHRADPHLLLQWVAGVVRNRLGVLRPRTASA